MPQKKIPQQVIALGIVFALVLGGLIAGRIFLTPKSFGQWGHYRGDSVAENAAKEISYAGTLACNECHDDIYGEKDKGFHKNVACEVCHGPAAKHVATQQASDPQADKFLTTKPKGRDKCLFCHNYNPARPTGFPQVLTEQHNPGKACMECHKPHSPTTPNPPAECSACHREINNKKMVSPHSVLNCTDCHTVPELHPVNPRDNLPTKPKTREFCGKCHAPDAVGGLAQAPRVDILSHGGRYLCWDCHYPHSPEANQ